VPVRLEVTPDVDLLVDGRPLGRSPWAGTLPAGRRVITLLDRAQGINTTRVLVLRGERVTEEIVLQKGSVSVTAPEGGVVSIDGLQVGVAPLRGDLPLYEGQHVIQVLVGPLKWREAFTLQPRQRVSFNVEAE
jgi:serine/threonine-protein kinase